MRKDREIGTPGSSQQARQRILENVLNQSVKSLQPVPSRMQPQFSSPIDPDDIASPCLKVCKMGTAHLCVGCYRTIEEIAGWGSMDAKQRMAVLAAAQSRRRVL